MTPIEYPTTPKSSTLNASSKTASPSQARFVSAPDDPQIGLDPDDFVAAFPNIGPELPAYTKSAPASHPGAGVYGSGSNSIRDAVRHNSGRRHRKALCTADSTRRSTSSSSSKLARTGRSTAQDSCPGWLTAEFGRRASRAAQPPIASCFPSPERKPGSTPLALWTLPMMPPPCTSENSRTSTAFKQGVFYCFGAVHFLLCPTTNWPNF